MCKLLIPLLAVLVFGFSANVPADTSKPNIIFILADDLGYGDLGCFGQKIVKTPRLDQMAAEGMKLTSFYAGSTVCAPSRSVLMTGQDTGHTWVRGNGAAATQTLRPEDVTVAEKLKEAGYATALCGKWGLGELGSTGHPNKQGFDYFFGYLNQRHAHNFNPEFIIRNETVVKLRNELDPAWIKIRTEQNRPDDGAGWAASGRKVDYVPAMVTDEALKWVDEQAGRKEPFFLYYALNIPHANNEAARGTGDGQEIPDYGIYSDKDWSNPNKGFAAMNTMMDRDVGRLLDLLKKHEIEKNTLVVFTSDNGHHKEGGNDPEFFDCNGPLRGMKRDLTEGGIRMPTIAWWPGQITAGSASDHAAQFSDFMATACDLAGVKTPQNTQSTSFLPTLLGKDDEQIKPEFLYWEFYEKGSKQAVRFGKWKAIRKPIFSGNTELYDLESDLGEENNLAEKFPDLVKKAEGFMKAGHEANPNWKVRNPKKG
ncbi:MAG: arylsulfatase [Verrucomicrobiales bacterium]|nr:arylsulfatase [Verrucomicrobiales bacterium]